MLFFSYSCRFMRCLLIIIYILSFIVVVIIWRQQHSCMLSMLTFIERLRIRWFIFFITVIPLYFFICFYVFSTVQSYCVFHAPTIPLLGHSIYHKYGISSGIVSRNSSDYSYFTPFFCQENSEFWPLKTACCLN